MIELKDTEFSRQVFEQISSLENQIEDLAEELKRRKVALQEYVAQTIKSSPPEEVAIIAPVLYWVHTTHISADTVKAALGLKNNYPMGVLGNFAFTMQCHHCGNTTKIRFSSRSDYLHSLKGNYRYPACDDCKAKREQDNEARWHQFEESREREQQYREFLRTMPYYEYLQTDHWKETRKAALKRAGFRCQVCNTNERTLHVHHRTYERRGQELARDLIALCESCHQTFHDNGELA
jgi:5-methylcytosine-specific restriction endonuclease McrA